MKRKILSIVLTFVLMIGVCVPVFAEESTDPLLTLDFNKRYTDISEYEDVNDPYLDFGVEKEKNEEKRDIYAIVLIVLLVIAIVVFIYTLRKNPTNIEKKVKDEKSDTAEKTDEPTSLKDEEKTE